MTVYRIRNWSRSFENHKSRGVESCRYVCMPNKQDGLGLSRILAEPDGATIFGVWCLILQACSRHPKRDGWLTDDGTEKGRPWDLDDLAFRWRRPSGEVRRCLDVVCSHKIGWMEALEAKCPLGGGDRPPSALKEGKEGREGTAADTARTIEPLEGQDDLFEPSQKPPAAITPERHLVRLCAIGLWLKDDHEREVAIEAIRLYGGAAMEARAAAIKHGRPTGRIFLSELTVGTNAPPVAPAAGINGEAQRTAIATKLVARVGWERCADAADIPRDRIGDAETMVEAMREPGIFARIVTMIGEAT